MAFVFVAKDLIPIRDSKTDQWRPTRIICDDIEEDEHINNPNSAENMRITLTKAFNQQLDIDGFN